MKKFFHNIKLFIQNLKREQILQIGGLVLVIAFLGSILVYIFEQKSPERNISSIGDAFYWAIISITTTGYGDKIPSTMGGKIIAMIMVVSGFVLLSMVTATIASVFVAKRIKEDRGLEKIGFKNHIILCGWNMKANEVIDGLIREFEGKPPKLVLINELNEEDIESLRFRYHEYDFKFVRGDFTNEEVLKRANISKADSAIILADTSSGRSSEQADERTIIGSHAIKSLSPGIKISAEIVNEENRQHLKRIKVDSIIIRGEHLGTLLASAIASPGLPKVFSLLLSPEEENKFWKFDIPKHLIGKTFRELWEFFRKEYKAIVIAIIRETKTFSLEDILSHDLTAIDQFIKRKFEEAAINFSETKERRNIIINPEDDFIISENDTAIAIAKGFKS